MIFNLTQGGGGYKLVTPPTVTVGTYTYNGSAQGPTIVYATDTQDKIETTNATKTAAGTYTLTFTLKATNKYVWSDGTTAPKTYEYTIAKQTLSVPSVTNTSKTYNGSSQGPTIGSYDSDLISVANSGSNVTSATDAGTYYVVFSLVDSDNYKWATGAVTTIEWTIAKASCGLSLSSNAVTLDKTSSTATVTVTRSGSGAITASSDDTSLVPTPSVSGTPVTISGTGTSGSATVTITVAETSNYLGGSATVTVTCDFLKIVQWTDSTATDEEIGAMIDAAQAGTIDLYDCGWRVGDVRTITISAFTGGNSTSHAQQDIDIVISQFGDYNSCGAVMQFDFKDELATAQRWDPSTNAYGTSEMKVTTLPALVNALPSWLKDRLIEFGVLVASNGNGSITTVTGNKLALRSEVEIFGSTTYSKSGEGSQIDYYKTSANRVKKRGHSGSASAWWERSPYSGNTNNACNVNSDGTANNNNVNNTNGLAPFGCIHESGK